MTIRVTQTIFCSFYQVRWIWIKVNVIFIIRIGVLCLVCAWLIIFLVHFKKFPIWTCTISCYSYNFKSTVLQVPHTLPHNSLAVTLSLPKCAKGKSKLKITAWDAMGGCLSVLFCSLCHWWYCWYHQDLQNQSFVQCACCMLCSP